MNLLKNTFFLSFILLVTVSAQNDAAGEWSTVFERSNFLETADYDTSIRLYKKLAESSEYAEMKKFGTTPQGRDMYYFIVSKNRNFTPEKRFNDARPLIFITNGIHAGEIAGKDACAILLREMMITGEESELFDNVDIMIIPVFNVDGHERRGKYSRINQDGPVETGWRTTAQNLNLNRDWLKADAPEMQNLLKLFSAWLPDFMIDVHTTDGADFQYSVLYSIEKDDNVYSAMADFVKEYFIPHLEKDVEERAFPIWPYYFMNNIKPEQGVYGWVCSPRLSNGYGAIQNRMCLLVEMHSLKPYKERVFGALATIKSTIDFVQQKPDIIIKLNKEADKNSAEEMVSGRRYFPVEFTRTDSSRPFNYKGIKFETDTGAISGAVYPDYTGEPYEEIIPLYDHFAVTDSVKAPYAYLIPPEWSDIAERLALHGVEYEVLDKPQEFKVTQYKFAEPEFAKGPYESHTMVEADYDISEITKEFPAGTYLIRTDQRTIRVIMTALEPKASDSFLRWGFFNVIFERKEYFEIYSMEPLAEKMIKEDPELAEEFYNKLESDEEFRNSPRARLGFFYKKSPYFDENKNVYPIYRLENREK